MTKFNQDKFESDAKKLVAKYLHYKVNEKEVFIVWFSKVGANAKAMLSSNLDWHYFEITYFGEEGKYVVDAYDLESAGAVLGEKSNSDSISQVKADANGIQVSIADKVQLSDESKCPVCQEHHNVWGLTDAFDLHLKEDILILTDKSSHNDMRFPKDAFKIKYCPFCGRLLNEVDN